MKGNPRTLSEIRDRTCCRNFNPKKKVNPKLVRLILEAGQMAPSAKNRQPYFFITIFNRDCRREIFDAAQKGRRKQFAHLSQEEFDRTSNGKTGSNDKSMVDSSIAILVMRSSDPKYKEASEQSKNLNIKEEQGVATAVYSMQLQARHLGLDSGWICSPLYLTEELKPIFKKYEIEWQDNWEPRVIIPIGYALENPIKPQRKSLEEVNKYIY